MKRINKILWHGNEIPLPSAYEGSLDGLNRGELFIYEDDSDPSIFIKTSANNVKKISGGVSRQEIADSYVTKTTFNTLKTDFDNLSALLNDDVQGKINTWHEVVDFLDEYSGSQDLATILSGMNTDIASRVEKSKFAEYFNSEMAKWFVKDDTNKGIKPVNSYGLYSDTYVSAKGVSTGSSGGGGGTSYDRLDSWAEYTSAKAGYVLSALLGYDLNTRVNNLANAGYITASALSGYAKLSDIPTSLPASDVYSWAKAASKPSYAFSEITNKPTTLGGYGITDAYTATTIDGKLSGYLPLSGGMITSNSIEVLSLNTKSASLYPAIGFYNNGTLIGVFRLTGNKTASIYDGDFNTAVSVITSGNIGSQSVNYANIANHSNYTLQHAITSFDAMSINTICGWYDWGNVSDSSFSKYTYGYVATSPDENIYSYIGFTNSTPDMRVRTFNYGKDSGWKTIAFTDSNVASATKLQTPRSIWGQSFDGTGDVSGFLNGVDFVQSNTKNGYFVGNRTSGLNNVTDGGLMLLSYGNTPISFHTNASTRMKITSAGNIIMGTTTDWGFNLASIALCNVKTSGYLGNGGGAFFGNIVEGYGTAIWTQGNGRGCIQQGRSDGDATNYHLCLQPLGGNVGIGTTSPTEKLYVAGNIVATGSVTAKSSSDYRLKCEFDYNVDYQERLLSLGKVCDFNYTPHAQAREFAFADDKRHTSVIWQDARKANITGFCSVEEDGYGTVNPLSSDLIFTMVGAIQQGITKTEKIEERVVRLEKENRELKEKINLLEGGRYGC